MARLGPARWGGRSVDDDGLRTLDGAGRSYVGTLSGPKIGLTAPTR